MTNNTVLMVFGLDWSKASMMANGQEVAASCLYLHIECDDPTGGICGDGGSETEAWWSENSGIELPAPGTVSAQEYVSLQQQISQIEDVQYPIFPGHFEADLNIPTGTDSAGNTLYRRNLIVVENNHPTVDQNNFRVWWNQGEADVQTLGPDYEVTDRIIELLVELDYPKNIARAYIRVAKPALFGLADTEVAADML